jgi:hypothetical protein
MPAVAVTGPGGSVRSTGARGLRQFRNVGAHAELGELTKEEAPILENLTRAILEYVSSAPLLIAQADFVQ